MSIADRSKRDELAQAQQRLARLYEIIKLLTHFEGAAETIPKIIAVVCDTLPLRTAIVVVSLDPPVMLVTRAQGATDAGTRIATARARASCAYLAGAAGVSDEPDEPAGTSTAAAAASHGHDRTYFITLPLVVAGHPTFGAFQLEGNSRFDESDLEFANAIANQLAMAIHRQRTVEAEGGASPLAAADEDGLAADSLIAGAEPFRDLLRERHEALRDKLDKVFVWEAATEDATEATAETGAFRFPFVSTRADELLGYPRELGIGQKGSWIDHVHPEDRDLVMSTLEAVARGESDKGCLHRCLTAAGEVRWFNTTAHLSDAATGPGRLQGVSVDVTALKQAEEVARRQLDFVQVLTRSVGEGIFAVDLQRRITFMNPTAEAMLACEAAAVVGTPVDQILELRNVEGRQLGSGDDPLAVAIVTGEACRSEESSIRRTDGTMFPVSLRSAPLSGAGQVTGAVMVFQSITEVKRAEQQQRFLAKASAVLASSLDYGKTLHAVARLAVPLLADLCIFDELGEDGGVTRLAVAGAEEVQRKLATLSVRALPHTAAWMTHQASAMESGNPTLIEDLRASKDEVSEHAEHDEVLRALGFESLMVLPLLARGRTLGALTLAVSGLERRYSRADVALAEDLARRAAIAVDNARLAQAAQREIRSRQDLLSIVSHDLQNPLSVILLSLQRMQGWPALDERSVKQLSAMTRSAHRMHRMIRDLLDTASIEGRHLTLVRELIDVAPMIAETVAALSPEAENHVAIEQQLGPGLPRIFADEARLQRVLVNLAGNALKFTAAGGTITMGAAAADGAVRFWVSDTGSGIAAADLGHLFERFYQAKGTARAGTGLGLFIVRGIIEAHGGRVWVESQLGVGSTFFFTIPIPTSEPAGAA